MGQVVINTAAVVEYDFGSLGKTYLGFYIHLKRFRYMVEHGLEQKYWYTDDEGNVYPNKDVEVPRDHPLLVKAVMDVEDRNGGEKLKAVYIVGNKYKIIKHDDGTEEVLAPSIIEKQITDLIKLNQKLFGVSPQETLTNINV